ncbi:hypothetical protein MKUB_13820 [Mycobacterium kubicae]|uniref:Mycothiol-dependent maleylpyruvate isomerase metal-binding domain-containing protein n=1 Tax=Mycobacterium kubicae TaxID=120959 RepID=A0ABQ1BJK0_9MYCO|nr:maleylpyruvate isomerase family mycothiol-dependent enzyme [Mycobacterium kubicae]ORV94948.1 hypothetical protein AWC13_21530 [Mycobacterium kubicae]GFG63892.1 hypothetical protein MKUB_13820 [Mycobacterium kubicae]
MTPALASLLEDVAGELQACAEIFEELTTTHFGLPTPCRGWTVADLAIHVATGAFRDAEAFHRARLAISSPPGEVTLDSTDYATAVRLAAEHLRAALALGPPRWPAVPTPFGTMPVAVALQSLVVEFGVHRNDLEVAAGRPDTAFSAATLSALFGFGDHYLLRQAAPVDSPAFALALDAPAALMGVTWTGTAWIPGRNADRLCRVSGSDDDIARLMLRRLDIDDPRLDVHDPFGLAALFSAAIRPL